MKFQKKSSVQTMTKAINVEPFNDFSIIVDLEDGRSLRMDLSHIKNLNGPVVDTLKNISEFNKVFVQDGIVTWPTGYDIDPYYILEAGIEVKKVN